MIFERGQSIADGRYRIESFIAHGGMAEVWRVVHLPSGGVHALKILKKKALRQPDQPERFLLEYDLVKGMNHPHIIHVHEQGMFVYEGVRLPWFTMDYYPNNMRQRLAQVSIGEGLNLLLPVLDALHYGHERKLCHRDLKPMNILVSDTGKAVLSDFGIAKETDRNRNLTGRNIIGTPHYISPEQCMGLPVTPASDIYAFGVILYQLCTGHFPFEDQSEVNIIRRHINEAPRPVHEVNPAVSDALNDAIERCLKKKPEERWQSTQELARELRTCEEMAEVAERIFQPGQMILDGRYKVIKLIAQGGYAEVWRVRNMATGRQYAFKICLPAIAYDKEELKRFQREIRILKAFNHPNIIGVIDSGHYPFDSLRLPYFVMRYYPGTLQSALNEQPIDPEKAMRVVHDVLDALAYAHGFEGSGVLHRDLKPSNILIDSEGTGYLTDFGIAKISKGAGSIMTRSATMTRAAMGTPYYMAPEQIKNEPVNYAADIYSMGVILYEVSTGRRPFDAKSSEQITAMHLYEQPQPPRQFAERMTPKLQALILRCLEKDPAKRYQSVGELLEALEKAAHKGQWFPKEGTTPAAVRMIQKGGRRIGGEVKRLATSPAPYAALACLVLGTALGMGGMLANARMKLGEDAPEAAAILRPAAISHAAVAEPVGRIATVVDSLGEWAEEGAGPQVEAWSDPVLTDFIPPGQFARYDALAAYQRERVQAGDALEALRAERRLQALVDAYRPKLAVAPSMQASQPTARQDRLKDVRVALDVQANLQRVDAGALAYRWRLDGEPGAQAGSAAEAAFEIPAVAAGRYQLTAELVYRDQTVAQTDPFEVYIPHVEIEVTIDARESAGDRLVEFTGETDKISGYRWQLIPVRGPEGSPVAGAAPIMLPEDYADSALSRQALIEASGDGGEPLLGEGVYYVRAVAMAQDREMSPEPIESQNEVELVIDRTPPQLVATVEREHQALATIEQASEFVLLPDEALQLSFQPSDNLAPANELEIREAATGRTVPAEFELPRDRGQFQFVAYDPATGMEGAVLEVRVNRLAREHFETVQAWRQTYERFAAGGERFARAGRLAQIEQAPELIEALQGDPINRDWLEAHVEDDALFERMAQTRRTLEQAMAADETFADSLAQLEAQVQAIVQGPALDQALGQLAALTPQWRDEAALDASPVEFIKTRLSALLPAIQGEMFRIDQDENRDWRLTLPVEAAGLSPEAAFTYRFALAQGEQPPRSDNLVLNPQGDPIEEYLDDPFAPIQVHVRTTVDAGEFTLESPPLEYQLPAPIDPSVDPAVEAAIGNLRSIADTVRQMRAEARQYERALMWIDQSHPEMIVGGSDPNMAWLARFINEPEIREQIRTARVNLEAYRDSDRQWAEWIDRLEDQTPGWASRHRQDLLKQARETWLGADLNRSIPDSEGFVRNYAGNNADDLLTVPGIDFEEAEFVRQGERYQVRREALAPWLEDARLMAAWLRPDEQRRPEQWTQIPGGAMEEQVTLPELPGDRRAYELALVWRRPIPGADGQFYESSIVRGGEFRRPEPTPEPTVPPTPVVTATPEATAEPTATPQPEGLAAEDGRLFARYVTGAIKTQNTDKKFDNVLADYEALFAGGQVQSDFLATLRENAGRLRELVDQQPPYLVFRGAEFVEALDDGRFRINYVQWIRGRGDVRESYLVTIRREGDRLVLVKDERAE